MPEGEGGRLSLRTHCTCVVLAGLWVSLGVEGLGLLGYTGRLIGRGLGQMDGGRDSVEQLRRTGGIIATGF
jgi:hypothetical protein